MRVVEGVFEKLSEYFVINSALCVRVRHKNASCTACTDVCPAGAVKITRAGGKVLVDWSVCTDCGKCVNVCMNSVFTLRRADTARISASAAEQIKAEGSVRYSCARSKSAENTAKVSALAYISRRQIIKAASEGAKRQEFIHGDCSVCPAGGCIDMLTGELEAASKILELCGKEPAFLIRKPDEAPLPKKKSRLAERLGGKQDIKLSRREFFGFLRTGAEKSVGRTLHYLGENDSNRQKTVLEVKETVAPHREFLQSLESLGGDILIRNMQREGLLKRAEISADKCAKCGICARMCPFQIFEPVTEIIKGREITREINVKSVGCTGCGLCVISCPYGAVSVR
ncbi:MAG: 4Fe-4S dicluster domain-containing protein [Deferribacterales bacterium]